MKTIITYQELSQLTEEKLTFSGISEKEIRISGKIKALLFSKEIDLILKIERVGYSSIDFSTSNPSLVSIGISFLPGNLKNSIERLEDGKIKINFRKLTDLTQKLKIDNITFGREEVIIEISPR